MTDSSASALKCRNRVTPTQAQARVVMAERCELIKEVDALSGSSTPGTSPCSLRCRRVAESGGSDLPAARSVKADAAYCGRKRLVQRLLSAAHYRHRCRPESPVVTCCRTLHITPVTRCPPILAHPRALPLPPFPSLLVISAHHTFIQDVTLTRRSEHLTREAASWRERLVRGGAE